MNFNSICIITGNFPVLRKFYIDVLQMQPEGDANFAGFACGDSKLTLFSKQEMENMVPGCMVEAGSGNIVIEVEVEDVDAEYQRLKSKNVTFVKLPTTQPWGIRSVWFRDPDGNIINFYAKV